MTADTRLKLGIALLVLGLVMPVGAFPVAGTSWPVAVKAMVSGVLLFGFEITLIPAVALMGKDNFDRIRNGAMRHLRKLKPAASVSRRRYSIGLVLFVAPILFSWIVSYVPSWLPGDYLVRVWINLGLDLLTLASLFVLGGEFWDKLRALFLYDAHVVLPSASMVPRPQST
jgi:hypothetical protein